MRNNKKKERFLHYVMIMHVDKNNTFYKYYCLRDNLRYENTFKN